jgi:hypothetical protein
VAGVPDGIRRRRRSIASGLRFVVNHHPRGIRCSERVDAVAHHGRTLESATAAATNWAAAADAIRTARHDRADQT